MIIRNPSEPRMEETVSAPLAAPKEPEIIATEMPTIDLIDDLDEYGPEGGSVLSPD